MLAHDGCSNGLRWCACREHAKRIGLVRGDSSPASKLQSPLFQPQRGVHLAKGYTSTSPHPLKLWGGGGNKSVRGRVHKIPAWRGGFQIYPRLPLQHAFWHAANMFLRRLSRGYTKSTVAGIRRSGHPHDIFETGEQRGLSDHIFGGHLL